MITTLELLSIAGLKTLAQGSTGLTNDLSSCLGYLTSEIMAVAPNFSERSAVHHCDHDQSAAEGPRTGFPLRRVHADPIGWGSLCISGVAGHSDA